MIDGAESPDPKTVALFHKNSDVGDSGDASQHHFLGSGPSDAAKGSHQHKGSDGSVPLFDNVVITGSRATNTASILAQLLTALADYGLTDSTTP